MRTPIIALAAILTGTLLFYGCGDDKTPVGSVPTFNRFPSAIGMLWVYEVYDSLSQTVDTVVVSVTDSYPLCSPHFVFQWRIYWTIRDSVVDRHVIIKEDTVEFLADTTAGSIPLECFEFPLELGSQWTGPELADTSWVTNVGTVSVPAGHFPNSATIERSWDIDIEGGGKRSESWIAPNVGIVYRYFHSQYSDGGQIYVTKNQTWELVRYDLSKFPLNALPNTIGTQWVYEVVDTSTWDIPETVTVTVESKIPVSWADSVTRWTVIGKEISEIWYLAVEGNRVHVLYDTVISPIYDRYYDFPLAVGRHWGIESFAPEPIIDDKGAISVPAGQFASAFHYRFLGGGLNEYWTYDEWLAPGIGMVTANHWHFGWIDYYDRQWTLLSYEIVD